MSVSTMSAPSISPSCPWKIELLARTTVFLSTERRAISRSSWRSPQVSVWFNNITQRFGQVANLARKELGRCKTGDLLGLAIENCDQPVAIGCDHSRGQVLQERFVVDSCVLHLGEKLGVLDRDRELSAKNKKRALLDAAVNASGTAWT